MALAIVLENVPTITEEECAALRSAGIVTPTMLEATGAEWVARRTGLTAERSQELSEGVYKAVYQDKKEIVNNGSE